MKLLVLFISILAWSEINLCTATGEAELTVSFTQTSFTLTEGGEAVSVCVAVTPALVGEAMVVVELMSSEGFSQDITVGPTSTLTLTNTITQVCWNVAALDDLIFENSESFMLTVLPLTAGVSVIQQSTVTVTVIDNDDVTVAMTYDQRSVTEGEMVMVCVTLTGLLGRSVVVGLTSTIGTASSEDFTLAPGELMFTPSSTNQKCSVVSATSDDIFEDDETFTVTLNPNSLPSGVTISGGSSTTVTIPANGGVTIQMMEIQKQVTEGGIVTVCALLTGQLGRNIEVRLATSSGGTASDTDFVSASVTRSFTATDRTDKCIDITTIEDNIFEANEMLTVSLSVVSPTTGVTVIVGRSQTTVIIEDDDEVMVEIITSGVINSDSDILVDEGQSVEVCARASGATISEREVVVHVATSDLQNDEKPATSGIDYQAFTMDATFTSSQSQVCGSIQTLLEIPPIYENNEVFSVSLSDASANPRVTLGAQKIVRIRDTDSVVVSLVNPTIVQNEGDGDLSVCARLDSPVGGTEKEIFITLNYLISSTDDFTFPSNSRVGTTRCLTITVTNNHVYQTSPVLMETVTLSKDPMALNQGRLDLTNTVTMVTINDDDDAVVSMVTPAMTTTEGDVVDVCADLVSPSGGTNVPITIVFTWSRGSDTATFLANSNPNTQACIQLTVADDDIYGTSPTPVYTVVLSISSPNSRVTVGGIGQTTVTVNDDDDETSSSAGKKFVVGFPRNYIIAGQNELFLFITNPESSVVNFTVTPINISGTVSTFSTSVNVPSSFEVLSVNERNKGILVEADGNINLYGMSYHSVSADAYLALPCSTMAVDKYEYYGISYGIFRSFPSVILLVACENETVVKFNSSTITLNSMETYQIESDNDLTGTRITSSKPLSVFSGLVCAEIPQGIPYCDHLVEQVPPTVTWGSKFLVASLEGRSSGERIRVLSARAASITVNCNTDVSVSEFQLQSGGSFREFEIPINSFCSIETTSPVLVAQYAYGRTSDGVGDPFMMIIPPIEQYTNNYVVEAFPLFASSYVTVYVSSEFFQTAQILLDNSIVTGWRNVTCSSGEVCGHISRTSVSTGAHSIRHQNNSAVLGVSVYGFDRYRSYGYPGGMRLSPIQCNCGQNYICLNDREQFNCSCLNGFVASLSGTDEFVCIAITCPPLTAPTNGFVTYSSTSDENGNYALNAMANHSCDTGFVLVGNNTRTCTGDGSSTIGVFDGDAQFCELICILPAPPLNGALLTNTNQTESSLPSNVTLVFHWWVRRLPLVTTLVYGILTRLYWSAVTGALNVAALSGGFVAIVMVVLILLVVILVVTITKKRKTNRQLSGNEVPIAPAGPVYEEVDLAMIPRTQDIQVESNEAYGQVRNLCNDYILPQAAKRNIQLQSNQAYGEIQYTST